ncbi:hypothetical protein [Polaribacter sp. Hel1_85]|uniref:hypothetical protein n=1 Tax=Polaribacter sp. Hel1_85 TaxID=1250005 RepID=UPI00052E0510|nr:hypothetical protein [Polaribacter sp. Hel1_85]KGL64328.1 hypothetical protein PHEL85_1383 [Polaribacter sp. Hel1_85]
MDKNKEILNKQKRQTELKQEVKDIKKKLPTFIIGFIFFTIVSLYFLENKFYQFFGNSVNFVIGIVIFLCIFSFFFIFTSYLQIKKREKESRIIGSQLYQLQKLEVEPKDE